MGPIALASRIADPRLRRMRPDLLAMLAAYVVGMLGLSRSYTVPTYMVLGMATVYLRFTDRYQPLPVPRLNLKLVGQLTVVSVVSLIGIYLFTRTFAQFQ